MILMVLLVLGGVAFYVMKPAERRRVAAATLRPVEDLWFAYQDDRARPDAFRDALRARTRWPLVTWAIVAAHVYVFVASPFAHPGFFAFLIAVAGVVQPAMLVERILGHAAIGAVFMSGAAAGTMIDFARHPLVFLGEPEGGVLAVYGALLAVVARGLLRRSEMTVPWRTLRRLVPAAAVFAMYALWTGDLLHATGAVPLALGFVFGIVLARHMTERRAPVNRVAAVAFATAIIVAAIGVPLRGVVDGRPAVAQVVALEDRTAAEYAAALRQFKLGALKAEAVAQLVDRRILPDLDETAGRLNALGRVPPEQQSLVSTASEYLTLRRESWVLRARALHKSNMRLLRDADDKERAALGVFDRLRPQQ